MAILILISLICVGIAFPKLAIVMVLLVVLALCTMYPPLFIVLILLILGLFVIAPTVYKSSYSDEELQQKIDELKKQQNKKKNNVNHHINLNTCGFGERYRRSFKRRF